MNELKRILEIKIENVVNKHIPYITIKDILLIMWWRIFNKDKIMYLIVLLEDGMNFRFACDGAIKTSKPIRTGRIKEYFDKIKKEVV